MGYLRYKNKWDPAAMAMMIRDIEKEKKIESRIIWMDDHLKDSRSGGWRHCPCLECKTMREGWEYRPSRSGRWRHCPCLECKTMREKPKETS